MRGRRLTPVVDDFCVEKYGRYHLHHRIHVWVEVFKEHLVYFTLCSRCVSLHVCLSLRACGTTVTTVNK